LLNPAELKLEKLEPLDLLPLLELLDDAVTDSEIVKPVLPPEFEMPGPELETPGPGPDDPLRSASLWVHIPSARYVFVSGTRIGTVPTTPSTRSSESMRSRLRSTTRRTAA
jgi:hypothetical protein